MRTATPSSRKTSHAKRHTRACHADGCQAVTRGGKPYCIDHVELNPHPQAIVARQEFEVCTRPYQQ